MSSTEEFTVETCREAVDREGAGEWVERFLGSDGSDNVELGRELNRDRQGWYGPVRVDFDQLHRLAGPDDQPTLDRMDSDDIETADDMAESLSGEGWEPPPVIATWTDDHLMVEDGNHRIEGLRRAGRTEWWTLVGFHPDADRSAFFGALGDSLS